MILIVKELYLLSAVTNMSHTCLKVSRAYAFLATKPSNTFSMAFEKVLEGLVKNGGVNHLNLQQLASESTNC